MASPELETVLKQMADRQAAQAADPPADLNAMRTGMEERSQAELVERKGPWRGLDDLEYPTLEWVDWFNHSRLFSAIGYVPPAEYEANLYRGTVPTEAGTQ